MSEPLRKRMLVLLRKPPHGSIFGQEALEAVLVAGAFEQDVTLLLMGDGVLNLLAGQQADLLEHRDLLTTFASLKEYDVHHIVVQESALRQRGLVATDLAMKVDVLDDQRIAKLIDAQDVVISF
ncbi:MAG: sulfurtransferase complex subunit TusC [Pseudomonadales bacterium]